MTDLACVYCGKPAYTVYNGDALCYEHWQSPQPKTPIKYKEEDFQTKRKYT